MEEIYAVHHKRMMTDIMITPTDVWTTQGSFSSEVTTPDAVSVTSYWQLGIH